MTGLVIPIRRLGNLQRLALRSRYRSKLKHGDPHVATLLRATGCVIPSRRRGNLQLLALRSLVSQQTETWRPSRRYAPQGDRLGHSERSDSVRLRMTSAAAVPIPRIPTGPHSPCVQSQHPRNHFFQRRHPTRKGLIASADSGQELMHQCPGTARLV